MKSFLRPGLALLLATLLTTCSRLNSVQISGKNFDEEVARTQNLIFTFNKDLVSQTKIGVWDSTQYVRFEPAIPGKFRWVDENELVFSPATTLRPATSYKAELTEALTSHLDGEKPAVDAEPIAFHTPYLQLSETELWWTRGEGGKPVAKGRLTFNYPVSSGEVTNLLNVRTEDEKPLSAQVAAVQPAEQIPVTLAGAPAGPAEQPLTVRLEKGLKVPNTAYVTSEALEHKVALPPANRLDVVDVRTGFDNNEGTVRVITTQELKPQELAQYFTLEPAVEVRTELTENGFLIRGAFNETDTYVLTLTDRVQGVLGARLEEPVSKDLFFGKMPAGISFVNKRAQYLSAKGSRNVGVQIVNVPEVTVKVAKVYENNILHYLKSGRYEEYGEIDGEWQQTGLFTDTDDEDQRYSDVLVDKTVATADLPKVRGVAALNLALPESDNRFRGVYLVTVGSKEQLYTKATKLISVSDIGLIAKQSANEVWVFANSIRTAEPLAGVDVTVVSGSNQAVATLKTDGNGVAHFENLPASLPGGSRNSTGIALVTAKTDADFNYLALDDSRVETSRFEVEGKRDNPSGFDALIYGDRDIYRPGETIHLNTVVRSAGWQSVGEIPLKIRVVAPNGREYRILRQRTNDEGAVATDIPIDAAAVTGTYGLEVYNANEVLLASRNVSVEEFIPDRLKVDAVTGPTAFRPGQTVTLTATATNLFGPPAANRTYEIEWQLARKVFSAPTFPEYTFSIQNNASFEKDLRQGVTNEAGQAVERFAVPPAYRDMGVLEGKIYTTIFDENSRPVNRLNRFAVFTQETFYGLRMADRYVGTNAPLPIDIVALNRSGVLQPGAQTLVEIVRFDYQTVIEKKYEQLRYISKKREKVVYTNTLKLGDGRGQVRYAPTVSGEYEVRVRKPGSESYTPVEFYAYGYGSTQSSSFEVSTEGQVLMTFDKPAYEVGDKAKVLFKTPFDGRLLVTLERNRVLETQVVETQNKSAELSFSLEEGHLPNVYVTATLIRPLDNSTLPLTVAHGFSSVSVTDNDTRIPVQLTTVEASRSKTRQRITVKTAANAELTVAVVDEGILQLKNFQTPDIHGYFYQKKALEITSHDLYGFLFPELSLTGASSFGGDGYNLGKRINPLSNGRVRLVTFWSGILKANGSGEATFDIAIPPFSGDLRIMAVAYKGRAFGSASRNMKVADPIVISTGVPRFLSPNDSLTLPVTISNTTKAPATVTAALSVKGALVAGSSSQKLVIPAGREVRATFGLRAKEAIGTGSVTVAVRGLNETFTETTDLTVRPVTSLLKTAQSGIVAGGRSQTIDLRTSFIPATVRSELVVSRSPLIQLARPLSDLLGYPYGCLEQTISKAFPQLYFAEVTKTIGKPAYFVSRGESDLNPNFTVQTAIRSVESRQLFNGGFGMWPGATGEDAWVTAYALHFLAESARAGFEVSPTVMSKAADYLEKKTSTPATEEVYFYEETGGYSVQKLPSRASIYGLYVLALNGQPNRPAMNYYKSQTAKLTPDSRYLLAAAFYLTGDTRSYSAIIPKSYSDPTTGRQSGGSYASPIRNLALVLNTLLETDADNLAIPTLARRLSQALNGTSYLNTQESAYAVLALGKLAKRAAASTATATVLANGKAIGNFTGQTLRLTNGIAGRPLTLATKGSGNLYWFTQSEGLSATGGYTDEDAGLRVRRQFLDRNGAPLSSFRQNDLVVVKITLAAENGVPVKNVVVTDMLPAAFEIENPRLTEPREMPWIQNAAKPDHFDVRDDRIHFFTDVSGPEQSFYYLVRVVSRGTFALGPVSADAMYDGSLRSYSGGGKLRVN
ncbi:alpha-2-macroglobulin family protein [Tellurirhabdus rosea]|uniref:alpha-2-macroglobulin family protein n=1 Tax=Tellurirhabdus rosea TaxID=2674997 RepID=UPI0022504730|nr:MG2 domain-containing protein [Tellurirhabdus rosea]